ncbi:MAG: chromosome partitioning protein ParB [Rhodospirillaceae bacterium]|nr:chromosome partitioning protein ParB [Rhodospirillaceae bacterium]
MNSRIHGLGQGLDALLGSSPEGTAQGNSNQSPQTLSLDLVRPSANQPRTFFGEIELQELAASIREKGILQPILVRPAPLNAGYFELVAGERRWRAAQIAQLHEIPVLIRELNDREILEIALIENIQRDDLNAIEEARGFSRLTEEFGETQESVAKQVGKSRSYVANSIRLLRLPRRIQEWLEEGALQAGHARALLMAQDPVKTAKHVIKQRLSVRQTEKLVSRTTGAPTGKGVKSADTRSLEAELSLSLRCKVTISGDAERGDVRIAYRDLSQLDRIIGKLRSRET